VDLSGLASEVADELKRAQPERKVDFVIAPQLEAYGDKNLLKTVLQTGAWEPELAGETNRKMVMDHDRIDRIGPIMKPVKG
jgi:hypothetical protein